MSSKIPAAYIDIRVSIHATENPDRVITAIQNMIPVELVEEVDFKKTNTKGHYNNPITLLEARIKQKEAVEAFLGKLGTSLTSSDKELLNAEIEQHLDGKNLFIRLDKQSAYLDEIRIRSADPIHLKIRFRREGKETIEEICRRWGIIT